MRRPVQRRDRESALAKRLRREEVPDALLRPAVDECIAIVVRGPEPMTLPWPLAEKDWTGREIKR